MLPIAVIGDVHGNVGPLAHAAAFAFAAGVTNLIQVGDFWLYESRYARIKVDRMLRASATEAGLDPDEVHLYFCDGNHEHFDSLDPDATEPAPLADHVTYVPRGLAITIAGQRVGFRGGAESIDRAQRTPGMNWWPEERMSERQILRAENMGPLDMLITHDTTAAVFGELQKRSRHAAGKLIFGERERAAITEIIAATQPAWHAHGHHHTWGLFRTAHSAGTSTATVSLAADGRAGAAALLGKDATTVIPAPSLRPTMSDDLDLAVTALP